MARFEMIDRDGLGALADILYELQELSQTIEHYSETASLWQCVESLNEMGVLDKAAFVSMISSIHDFADEGQEIVDYIQATNF